MKILLQCSSCEGSGVSTSGLKNGCHRCEGTGREAEDASVVIAQGLRKLCPGSALEELVVVHRYTQDLPAKIELTSKTRSLLTHIRERLMNLAGVANLTDIKVQQDAARGELEEAIDSLDTLETMLKGHLP